MGLVSLKKAAKALSKSEKTLRRWIKDGAPCEKDRSGAYLMNVEGLELWKRERDQTNERGRVTRRARPTMPKRRAALPRDPVVPSETPAISPVESEIADAVIDHDAEVLTALDQRAANTRHAPRVTAPKAPRHSGTHEPATHAPTGDFMKVRARLESEPAIPQATDLRRRATLNTLLRGAASATITRLPQCDIDLSYLGRANAQDHDTWGVTLPEIKAIVASGGFLPWLDRSRGRGRYLVSWNGSMGQLIHSEVFELLIPRDPPSFRAPPPEVFEERQRVREKEIAQWVRDHTTVAALEAMQRGVPYDDMPELRNTFRAVLEDLAPNMFPAAIYHERVCFEIEALLPRCPRGHTPWIPLMLPPGPSPKQRWIRDWLAAFDREHRNRTGLGAKPKLVKTEIAPYLWSRINMLFPRPPGDPAVWRELARFLPRRKRRA